MQTLRKKTSPCKYRNDPGRFFGDGVQFKAKLIGILEVGEARGDRMCQEALQDLKMAIRAAGEHKQRITIHVTIDGLRLRDEKTGDSLYHHPVHKISFIAQDMTDSRAFGYIFGSPDSGHRFFGIKTDKAASQVVLAMRDLFQVVFELKKKEIELARQQIQSKSIHEHQLSSLSSLKSAAGGGANTALGAHNDLNNSGGGVGGGSTLSMLSGMSGQNRAIASNRLGVNLDGRGAAKEMSPESVADLVDLEQELSSLQRGITQMERITPNEPSQPHLGGSGAGKAANDDDPFGDSFTNFPSYNLLPPPESGRSRHKSTTKSTDSAINQTSSSTTTTNVAQQQSATLSSLLSKAAALSSSPGNLQQQDDDDSWLHELDTQNDVFDTSKAGTICGMGVGLPMAPLAPSESTSTPTQQLSENSTLVDVDVAAASASIQLASSGGVSTAAGTTSSSPITIMGEGQSQAAVKSDAFTDLDPLGTGRTRPYVDKKYFFHELKNPPKRVLNDLSAGGNGTVDITATGVHYTAASAVVDEFLSKEGLFEDTLNNMDVVAQSEWESVQQPQQTTQQQNRDQQQQQLAPLNITNPTLASSDAPTGTTTTTATASSAAATEGGSDVVMMPRDTDPFSPTRKKSDPFQEGGDVFAKLDPFEFEFNSTSVESTNQRSSPTTSTEARRSADVFNGPLQVQLPPESSISPTPAQPPLNTAEQWRADVARLERQMGEPMTMMGNGSAIAVGSGSGSSTVRSRPTPSGQLGGMAQPSSVFKQQTADVISSISNKKMPHLFGQARFSKRDSNSINMCRLQESDSLSENEAAPEPPPRPDSALHAEPPPLPPKKQFNDIIIRPRVTSGNAVPPSASSSASTVNSRYEFVGPATANPVRRANTCAGDVPPIPLPSRRVGRTDGVFPGPGRPRKPGHTEDDYLAPITGGGVGAVGNTVSGDVPPLLPPPTQTSTRTRAQRQQSFSKAQDIYENKMEILQQQQQKQQQALAADASGTTVGAAPSIIPDITLSQLMTLSLDDLAAKLNVPVSKLSTMTLVELTSYLSEFIEKSKPQRVGSAEQVLVSSHMSPLPVRRRDATLAKAEQVQAQAPIFKVNFDQQATFVAKFDDTFGEDLPTREMNNKDQDTFANFEQFNEPPSAPAPILGDAGRNAPIVPPADRYAVFREIIDKELQEQQVNVDLIGEEITEQEVVSSAAVLPEDVEGVAALTDDIGAHFEANFDNDDLLTGAAAGGVALTQPPKIDTKITEVVAQAKDRYAALRDIILVENLFDNKPPPSTAANLLASQEFPEFSDEFNEDQDQDLKNIMDGRTSSRGPDRLGLVDSRGLPAEPSSSALTIEDDDEDDDGGGESSLDSNEKEAGVTRRGQDKYQKLSTSTQQLDSGDKSEKLDMNGSLPERSASQPSPNLLQAKQDNKFLTVAGSSGGLSSSKDDLEIDELMQRAISNLSLDSRERISPANSATNVPTVIVTAGSLMSLPRPNATLSTQAQFNDVSTSPIPLQKSPTQQRQQQRSPLSRSPQPSPVLTQLSAVSSLIDTATKQIHTGAEAEVKHSKEFWATFDSPKPGIEKLDKRGRSIAKPTMKAASLHLPPPPPSNTSQNDTAESPCSSDPRDEGWSKSGGHGRRWPKKERHQTSSSSRDLSPWDDDLSDFQKQKRISGVVGPAQPPPGVAHVADRHGYYMRHTRRLNSCDEDYDYEDEFNARRDHRKLKQGLSRSRDNFELESPSWYHHPPHHTWSPQEMEQAANLRARAAFERSAYERTTYGPPVYDKRGVALPPNASSSYDRRMTYDKRSKYYRDYARPNYDFDDYGEAPHERYRDAGPYDKPKSGRRADYENIYDDGRTPMGAMISGSGGGGSSGVGYKSRANEYLYERERKSFDRESVESFESATRRRRSFGSGDVYGSMESHEDFRERFGPDKTRSLRKSMKLRATGDIEYEQDSENDYHQRARMGGGGGANVGGVADTRSLQRPNQLASTGGGSGMVISGGQTRTRKSSGSSPWDGEEPPLPGQKSWKRPSSAADSERRHAESRRAVVHGQTPSGSDGEKDRRFRKKQRSRGKDIPYSSATGAPSSTGSRYSGTVPAATHPRDNYDYITYDDDDVDDEEDYVDEDYDEPPTDEDKFERLNRRRHEMHQRMLESERKQQHAMGKVPISALKCSAPINAPPKKYATRGGGDYDFDDYEQTPTPRSIASASLASGGSSYLAATTVGSCGGGGGIGGNGSVGGGSGGGSVTKFSFDGGFESDFNQSSPPPAPAGTASSCNSTPAATTASASATPATKSSFRFSNDFSEREKMHTFAQNSTSVSSSQQFDMDGTPSPAPPTSHALPSIITQKLRFDDNVKVSQFDDAAFEDDFSNAQFDFEKEDQWHADSLQNMSTGNPALMSNATKKHNLRNSKLQQRQELIKKSESINIFAKKSEDPFEDDEFFKAPTEAKLANNNNNGQQAGTGNGGSGTGSGGGFQCDDDFNFAKFDENM